MKFLSQIAQIYTQQPNLREFLFVFPNRRAGLFFRRELLYHCNKTEFAPTITDINSFIESLSPLHKAHDIQLLFALYNSYTSVRSKYTDKIDSIDSFIPFGTTLLADFNEIDKYLIDAKALFSNISDLKDLTDQTFSLSQEQIDIIKKFWENINSNDESLSFKQQFISLWNNLYEIYYTFKDNLLNEGIAYEGMIHRHVANNLHQNCKLPNKHTRQICFIGFNHLTPIELSIFKHFKRMGFAKFHFDYPTFYDTPSPLASSVAKYYNYQKIFSSPEYKQQTDIPRPNIFIHSTPSASNQINITCSIIDQYVNENNNANWAVILTDESLMLPLIEKIPDKISKINITMGNTLSSTPMATLIKLILSLQIQKTTTSQGLDQFYYKPILSILAHNNIQQAYGNIAMRLLQKINKNNQVRITITKLYDFINTMEFSDEEKDFFIYLFTPQNTANDILLYLKRIILNLEPKQSLNTDSEFIHHYKLIINQLISFIEKYNIVLDKISLQTLLQRLSTSLKVQLNGEPINGLQIMGPLESRLLDFDNIIIVGFNDQKFPGNQLQNTIIPNNLRKAYNLPTHETSNAIQLYNFYRTLYHTENMHLIYDSRTENSQNEISRYYQQIKYLLNIPIKHINYTLPIYQNKKTCPIVVEKNKNIIDKLNTYKTTSRLSVSRLKDYITCPLKFYFSTIANIEKPNKIEETGNDSILGLVFHKTMELYYNKYSSPTLINDEEIDSLIKQAFEIETNNSNQETNGFNILIFNITKKFIKETLTFEIERYKIDPFTTIKSEEKIEYSYNGINFVGYIDRIDTTANNTNIIDYKTTKSQKNEKFDIIKIFSSPESNYHEIFQILFYCLAYETLHKEILPTRPALYKTYTINNHDEVLTPIKITVPEELNKNSEQELPNLNIDITSFSDKKITINVDSYNHIKYPFEWMLKRMLNEIFDSNKPFTQHNNKTDDICSYCNFISICNKKPKRKN